MHKEKTIDFQEIFCSVANAGGGYKKYEDWFGDESFRLKEFKGFFNSMHDDSMFFDEVKYVPGMEHYKGYPLEDVVKFLFGDVVKVELLYYSGIAYTYECYIGDYCISVGCNFEEEKARTLALFNSLRMLRPEFMSKALEKFSQCQEASKEVSAKPIQEGSGERKDDVVNEAVKSLEALKVGQDKRGVESVETPFEVPSWFLKAEGTNEHPSLLNNRMPTRITYVDEPIFGPTMKYMTTLLLDKSPVYRVVGPSKKSGKSYAAYLFAKRHNDLVSEGNNEKRFCQICQLMVRWDGHETRCKEVQKSTDSVIAFYGDRLWDFDTRRIFEGIESDTWYNLWHNFIANRFYQRLILGNFLLYERGRSSHYYAEVFETAYMINPRLRAAARLFVLRTFMLEEPIDIVQLMATVLNKRHSDIGEYPLDSI